MKKYYRNITLGIIATSLIVISVLLLLSRESEHNGAGFFDGMMGGAGIGVMGNMMTGRYSEDATFPQDAPADAPWARPTKVVELKDGDTYEMSAGLVKQEVGNRVIRRLAYNGMIPGPILKVQKGAHITLKFTNNLPIATTLHSHGLRGDDDFDGLPTTMGGKQKPMQPGETFTYELTFPDAGVFWYHPHLREDYTQEMGLYGNYWVDAPGYWGEVDKEAFLIVDDFSENDPFYKDVTNKSMMGRFGNLLLINNDTDYTLHAQTGQTVRFFLTNTANTRVFDIALKSPRGESVPLKVVGGDIGRVEKEYRTQRLILAPAERIIFETRFTQPGTYTITHRGTPFGMIVVAGAPTAVRETALRENSADYAAIRAQMPTLLAKAPDKTLRLTIGMKGMGEMRRGMRHRTGMGRMMDGTQAAIDAEERRLGGTPRATQSGDGIVWDDMLGRMNAMSNTKMMEWYLLDETTGKTNMDITDWTFKKGQLVKVRIFNDPDSMHPMQHPIHFHGQRFVVLASDWGHPGDMRANDNLQWKDTALVRAGETVDLLVDMSNPGQWMAHCHIAEHLHAGMMLNFRVVE